jgi:hypothetical protein
VVGFGAPKEKTNATAKAASARRWVDAVTYAGAFGCWDYQVCRDVDSLRTLIDAVVAMKL